MKRKLVEQGGSTMMVSLPISWIKKYGLKKGDEIDVSETNNNLIVSTENCFAAPAMQVELNKLSNRFVGHILHAVYIYGYDECVLRYDSDQKKYIDEHIGRSYPNMVVEKQSSHECSLKSISENIYSELPSVIKRNFLVTMGMIDQIIECIKTKNFEKMEEIIAMERTSNQLANFCERTINKKGFADQKKANYLYLIAWNTEKIGDDLKYICKYLSSKKKPAVSREVLLLLEETSESLRRIYELYSKFDKAKLDGELGKINRFINNPETILGKAKSKDDTVLLLYIFDMQFKLMDYGTPLFIIHNFES